MKNNEKILGSLLGAAIGDAMGAATEMRTTELIKEFFGGYVTEILTPPADTFARGSRAGAVTDDFSLAYFTAQVIAEHHGKIDGEVAKEALLLWSKYPQFFRYAGPTTKAAVKALQGEEVEEEWAFLACNNGKATNGSAMKIGPIGLFNPRNKDKAIEDAVTICMPTHDNNLSIAGACAIAAAVSEAMKDHVHVYDIVEAGLYGARRGDELGRKLGKTLAGPSVEKRIILAVELALRAENFDQAMKDIADYVGSGLHVSEAVPAVFGLIVAAKGDPLESIYAGVNIGYDTDTVASMIGAIVGAMHGDKAYPSKYLEWIDRENQFNLQELAQKIEGTYAYA